MAGSKSDYLENKLLDHVLGGPDFVRPGSVFIALYTVAPSDSGGGSEVSAAGTGYSRAVALNTATQWPAAATGLKSNGVEITFGVAQLDWGTVVAFAIFDALVAGNMLAWATLTNPRSILTGDSARFPVGELDITED